MLNEDADVSVKNLVLMLTLDEAKELRDYLKALIDDFGKEGHTHVYDSEYQHSLTYAIYDETDISEFNQRIQYLLQHDK
jgi:PHP family Zn ribbon phosphoesterase